MAQVLAITLVLLASSYSISVPYHDRRVYYGEDDNACRAANDLLALTILFDDRDAIQTIIPGGVICN